jgi:hypothetical protein
MINRVEKDLVHFSGLINENILGKMPEFTKGKQQETF